MRSTECCLVMNIIIVLIIISALCLWRWVQIVRKKVIKTEFEIRYVASVWITDSDCWLRVSSTLSFFKSRFGINLLAWPTWDIGIWCKPVRRGIPNSVVVAIVMLETNGHGVLAHHLTEFFVSFSTCRLFNIQQTRVQITSAQHLTGKKFVRLA